MPQKLQKISLKKVIATSFLVDVLDVVLSLTVAILSGSAIMYTETLEGFSDLAASGILFIGFIRSIKHPDKTHPFGYGREIYFWALISALIMFGVTATFSIYFGVERLFHPRPIHNIQIVIFVLLITIGTNGYAFFLSYRRLLRKRSPRQIIRIFYRSSLVETKTTFILDMMGTTAAVIGLLALLTYVITGNHALDGIGAITMGIVVGIGAVFLIAGIRDLLVGKSASSEVEGRIKKAALSVEEVDDVLDLKTLHMGPERLLVNLDVHMNATLTTRQLEKLIDKIKAQIKKEVPAVKYIQVELETPRK